MKISIITAVYNRGATIQAAIDSVARQHYRNIEYVVVDGNSTDDTESIVRKSDRVDNYVRGKDDGIYDALNIGIRTATGDVIGFLHADDLLADEYAIHRVAETLTNTSAQCVYGDLLYVNATDPGRIIRYWRSGDFARQSFRRGWMPPHPTVYFSADVYERFGNFRTDMSISADYELMVRMLFCNSVPTAYVPHVQVKMRVGGKSNASVQNRLLANAEDRRAWELNDLLPPRFLRFLKPARKISQYWRRPVAAR